MEHSSEQDSGQKQNEEPTLLLEFLYAEGGRWFRTSVTKSEYLKVLNSGMLDNKPIVAVMIFEHEGQDCIYDFSLAKRGEMPWRFQ